MPQKIDLDMVRQRSNDALHMVRNNAMDAFSCEEVERSLVEIPVLLSELTRLQTAVDTLEGERDALINLIAYCDSCKHFGDRTPDGMGACMKDPKCWKHVSPDDYRPGCFIWCGPQGKE